MRLCRMRPVFKSDNHRNRFFADRTTHAQILRDRGSPRCIRRARPHQADHEEQKNATQHKAKTRHGLFFPFHKPTIHSLQFTLMVPCQGLQTAKMRCRSA